MAEVGQMTDAQPVAALESQPAAPTVRRSRLPSLGVGGWIGLVVLLVMAVAAIFAAFIAPYDPIAPTKGGSLGPVSGAHWMGTDLYSRDTFSRVIYGARVSLGVGLTVTAVTFVLGLLLGLVSAYYGRWLDTVIGRCTDALLAIPGILLAIAIVAVLGTGLVNVALALVLVYLPVMIRVSRGTALAVRHRLHVRAARALGASDLRIMVRHITPYIMGPVVVQATFVFAHAVLYEASLSFLGLGVQPPSPTWGNLISESLGYLSRAPLQVIFPSAVITITVLAVNLVGDALRDAVDPEGTAVN